MTTTTATRADPETHEHAWVRWVEFEDHGSVTRCTCACGQVWFE